MKKKKSGARTAMMILCVFLGLVLTALVGVTVYANHMMSLVGRVEIGKEETISEEELFEIQADETVSPDETTAPVMKEEDVDWGSEEEVQPVEVSENIVNILLIGQDARPGESRARSDSMILVTFNKGNGTITMTSFLRDLYVRIPGYSDNKLNAAFAAGGMELLDETLAVNFGVEVDGNVEVDFSHFADVINLLGGVEMEIRQDEANYINMKTGRYTLNAGVHNLDGEQALFYSRIRHLDWDADFSRTNRQRKVINALIEKFRNTKMTTLLGLLDDLLPMITTDMTNAEMIGYATDLFPMLSGCKIISQRVPEDMKYQFATIRGMSCVVADMDAARALIAETMKN